MTNENVNTMPCKDNGRCSESCIYYDLVCGCIINKNRPVPKYRQCDAKMEAQND